MSTDQSFGGLLVLSGHRDVSVAWRKHLIENGPYLYGDLQTGEMTMRPPVGDIIPAVADVAQGLTVKPYAFMCAGDQYQTANIPTRNTAICSWSHGDPTVKDHAIRLLLNVNRDGPVQSNYGELVHQRVFGQIPGSYASAVGYFSRHSRLLLCARGRMMFMWIVYVHGSYALVWSTNPNHMLQSSAYMPVHLKHELFSHPVTLKDASLVIQPSYLLSKFSRHLREAPAPFNRLTVIGYLESYLQRQQHSFTNTTEENHED